MRKVASIVLSNGIFSVFLVKPEFPSNTPKVVWISDKQASENKHVLVNITCIVDADPAAKLQWLSNDGIPINNGNFSIK